MPLRYEMNISSFNKIPGYGFDYWISKAMIDNFSNLLKERLDCRTGLICGNNEKYIRYWFEPIFLRIGFGYKSCDDTLDCTCRWFPYNHGGDKRRWYGSHFEVVNFKNNGMSIKSEKNSMLRNSSFYFKKGITWNRVGSGVKFAARMASQGFIFDDVSPSGFCNENDYFDILGYMNSKVFNEYLRLFSNGFKVEIGHISSIPYKGVRLNIVHTLSENCVSMEKNDWDAFEISWDFKKHPLV